ncbi:hypothetical protein A2U01_0054330, partial [Trifolium medium]|nr:hypothetical protein [Trifolium medium]
RINLFSSSSSSCFFNSFNSEGDIRYGAIDIGLVPGTKSIVNYTSLSGGTSDTSSENTSGNSQTIGNSSILTPPSSFKDANIINISACSFKDSATSFPLISCKFSFGFGNTTVFSQQLI